MRMRSTAAFVLLSLTGLAPLAADTVYLKNGRTFENVVAETTETEVKIRMPGGSLSLPRSHVLRVESSESAFAEYLRRKEAIRRGATAADWLALAQWAKLQGLDQGVREAALAAANLDPKLEGLAPLLRTHGFVLDEQLDRWIPYAESMRRRGFVQAGGQWISREEQEARQRVLDEEQSRRRAERAAAQASQATQAVREVELALASMELRDRLQRTEQPQQVPVTVGWPVYVIPGAWTVPPTPCYNCGPQAPPDPQPQPAPEPRPQRPRSHSGTFHVPGSLLPGTLSAGSSGN